MASYKQNLEVNLGELHSRIHRGHEWLMRFVEHRIGDRRINRLIRKLNTIYEEDFLGFSYGFRPGRGQHDALDALAVGITRTKVNWIVDADIAGFFDAVLSSSAAIPSGRCRQSGFGMYRRREGSPFQLSQFAQGSVSSGATCR